RILIRDALVHLEQVAVALADGLFAQARDGIRKIEIDAEAVRAHPQPRVAYLLGRARGDVARREISEAGILALQVVVALRRRNLVRRPAVARLLRNPDPAVVPQRLAHERELGLMLAALRDARRMDLRVTGIGERSSPLVRTPDGGAVRTLGIRGQVEH